MKLEISSEKPATKQNILMVLGLLNKFHLKLKYFSCPLVSDSQLCFLLPHSAFCSWDYANHIFIFPSWLHLCSEKSMLEEDCMLGKEKKDPLPFALRTFPLLAAPV